MWVVIAYTPACDGVAMANSPDVPFSLDLSSFGALLPCQSQRVPTLTVTRQVTVSDLGHSQLVLSFLYSLFASALLASKSSKGLRRGSLDQSGDSYGIFNCYLALHWCRLCRLFLHSFS